MSKHRTYTLEELRVKATESPYFMDKYRTALIASNKKKKVREDNFEDFLADESAKCVFGYNPYQE